MKKSSTKSIVFLGLMAALSIVLGSFCTIYITNDIRISLVNIPIILTSLWFGPFAGMAVGAVSDIIKSSFFSPLSWYPPLTVTPILFGLIPAILKRFIYKERSFWRLFIIIMLTNLVGTIGCTTIILSNLYGTDYLYLLSIRGPLYIGIAIVETISIYYLDKSGIEKLLV